MYSAAYQSYQSQAARGHRTREECDQPRQTAVESCLLPRLQARLWERASALMPAGSVGVLKIITIRGCTRYSIQLCSSQRVSAMSSQCCSGLCTLALEHVDVTKLTKCKAQSPLAFVMLTCKASTPSVECDRRLVDQHHCGGCSPVSEIIPHRLATT